MTPVRTFRTSRTSPWIRAILIAAVASASVAVAQTSSTTTRIATTPAPSPATAKKPTDTLVNGFADLAGSRENAASLVHGLRMGSAITLTDPVAPAGSSTTFASISFTPGTRPMGYGNIRIALSLAKAQLASQGIDNPTPEQLRTALIGPSGTTATAAPGILQMRAAGMGWGQIAQSMGVRLGAVMSGRSGFPAASTTVSAAGGTSRMTSGAGVAAGTFHGRPGITSAAGSIASGGRGVTTGLGGGSYAAAHASGARAGGGATVSNAGGLGRGRP